MYLTVEIGGLAADRYRLVSEEREGNGGRLFHAKDERATIGQVSEVGLKLVHPGIAADPALLDLLENEIGVIRQATHPHLVRYWRVERGSPGPWLVREWVHGFLLFDLLRWRQSLRADELLALLGPLASTLDFVSSQGLGLVDVSVRKILVACPPEITLGKSSEFARGDAREWSQCRLLLNPLSLAPLLFRNRNGWDRQTIVPASRVLSMTRAEAGSRGRKAVRLYGRLVYELLSGHASIRDANSQKYTPLPELDQAGNETLRRACVVTDSAYPNCEAFWKAFQENLAGKEHSFKPAAQPLTSISTVASPPPPAKLPKRNLLVGALVGGALIIALALFSVTRFGGAGSKPLVTPTPSAEAAMPVSPPAIAPSPTGLIVVATPSAVPVAVATPTPIPIAAASTSATPLREKMIHQDFVQSHLPGITARCSKSGRRRQPGCHEQLGRALSERPGHRSKLRQSPRMVPESSRRWQSGCYEQLGRTLLLWPGCRSGLHPSPRLVRKGRSSGQCQRHVQLGVDVREGQRSDHPGLYPSAQLVPKGRRRRPPGCHVQFGRALRKRTGRRPGLRQGPRVVPDGR